MSFLHAIGKYFLMIKISFTKTCKREVLYKQIFKEINDLVLDSIQIVSILSFFIGGVVSIQMALNLENPLLSKTLIGFATRQSVILEFAPTFISIIMAGKVGSYITSSIGTMRVTEQIDALRTLSTNPFNYLVIPRILAGVISLPILVLVGDIIGVLGGFLICTKVLNFNATVYLQNTYNFLQFMDVFSGLVKACVFGFIITFMGCYHGFNAKGGAQGVGLSTTYSVVSSSILILLMNYILTSLFFKL